MPSETTRQGSPHRATFRRVRRLSRRPTEASATSGARATANGGHRRPGHTCATRPRAAPEDIDGDHRQDHRPVPAEAAPCDRRGCGAPRIPARREPPAEERDGCVDQEHAEQDGRRGERNTSTPRVHGEDAEHESRESRCPRRHEDPRRRPVEQQETARRAAISSQSPPPPAAAPRPTHTASTPAIASIRP